MRFSRMFCRTRSLVSATIDAKPALNLPQMLPRVLQRPSETAAGCPQLFAALDLGGAALRRDALKLRVEKLPEVRKPGREFAGVRALHRLQSFLRAFRLADAGGAEVLELCVGDVSSDVGERASLRRLRAELVLRDLSDERDDLLAEPLEAATVRALVFRSQRIEVRREARSWIALTDKRSFRDVRRDRRRERRLRIDVFSVAPQ